MKRILFLDLEETIIDIFQNGWNPVNTEFLQKFGMFDEVIIFSFAVHDDDIDSKLLDSVLDHVWNVVITTKITVMTFNEIEAILCNRKCFRTAFSGELLSIIGKFNSFLEIIQEMKFSDCEIVFIDDTITNCKIELNGCSIRCENPTIGE